MLPWIYGFHWSPATIIFLGAFYTVVVVIAATLIRVGFRSWRDMRLQRADSIRWHSDFHDLPLRDRACRHELTGELKHRECTNAFECATCGTHKKFMARRAELTQLQPVESEIFGLSFPPGRLYHRGHTWAKCEPDGTVTVGLDELGRRLLGTPDKVDLPLPGVRLHTNGTAWRVEKRGADVRVLSPVDGEVVAAGGPGQDWYLKLKPVNGHMDVSHLLSSLEVKPWIMRELERLQIALGGNASSASLADGGVPVEDIAAAYPGANWDAVCGEMFLEP
jgi:glycine cleavage system H lipoate-binding protein